LLHIQPNRILYLDASRFVYSDLKCWPCLLDVTCIPVLHRTFTNSSLFTATCKTSQSAKRVSAANHLCKNERVFRKHNASLKQILRQYVSYLYQLIHVFDPYFLYCFCLPYSFCFVLLVPCFRVFVLFCFVFLSWFYNKHSCC